MKIIISPSKTQQFKETAMTSDNMLLAQNHTDCLVSMLQALSIEEMGKIMKIDNLLLEETYNNYQSFYSNPSTPAIHAYTGLVYKGLNIDDYDPTMLTYIQEHLTILSALYGVLRPFDFIRPYRLDMKMSITHQTLYSYWKDFVNSYYENETILDLASTEFSKMISLPKTTIGFRDYKKGQYKNVPTYAKMARGQFLNHMIQHQIKEIEPLKDIAFNGYHYNADLSKKDLLIFTRFD